MVNAISKEMAQHIMNGGYIACKHIHDNSCEWTAMMKVLTVMKIALTFYLPIHLVPVLLFKRKKLME